MPVKLEYFTGIVLCSYLSLLNILLKNPFFLGAGASREPRIPLTPTMYKPLTSAFTSFLTGIRSKTFSSAISMEIFGPT